MDHRALVRSGRPMMMRTRHRLTIAALTLVLILSSRTVPAQDAKASTSSMEETPYAIRAWLAVDPQARVGAPTARALAEDWLVLVRRFVGEPWQIELADDEGALRGRSPSELTAEIVAPGLQGADKGWFLRVEPADSGGGYLLVGREFDATTRQLGPLYRQPAPYPRDAARSLFELSRRIFAPVAEIERTDGGAELLVQGASLPAADPIGRVVEPDSIFRPYYLFLRPDKTVQEIRSIPFTYLRVVEIDGARARCELVSGLRQPLPRQVAGRYRLVALGLKPADVPTRFRFVAGDGDQEHPAAGYVLTARGVGNPVASEVGTTDREGRIALPPHYSDSLVILRLLAGGVEPLREFPVLPGETPEEREVPVEPRPEAVALEFRLKALQDEIVDLVARRGVLEAKLEARANGQAWDEVKQLLDEYQQLPPRRDFEERLDRLEDDAQRTQAELGVPILTRTAQAELAETRALVERYLSDEAYTTFLNIYRESQDRGSAAPTPSAVVAPAPPSAAPNPIAPAQARPDSEEPPQPAPLRPRPKPAGSGDPVPF
ncbi:hypothetical protein [Tautonia sociabilis]|uniref:GWxTD domain-containing protein n=1 Tax=Tautonia sociabilis TaxID=2080755 RepID=A0A432MPW3_9BACT|nr:hypothetical protein [Tautonia sociabilis]RUL89504.1 hypothetical protein TsocGM_01670 [Tautonia sociabilis]